MVIHVVISIIVTETPIQELHTGIRLEDDDLAIHNGEVYAENVQAYARVNLAEDLGVFAHSHITQMGEEGGFDAVAIQRYPQVETIHHVHTAGNSSGIVDGAAAVLLGSKRAARKAGIKPRARIRAFASIGSEPTIMLTGPAGASRKALKRARMKPADIDLWEINEAFASVVLRYLRDMDLSADKVNVNGGAIALGHPLGATGAVILSMVLDELERRDLSTALVTLCIGAGMGTATIIERV